MRKINLLAATACALAFVTLPVAAADNAMSGDAMSGDAMSGEAMSGDAMMAGDAMGTMGMMEGGEVMTFMPDGHMGKTMVSDPMTIDSMMQMATPIDHCIMIMTGADGKTYMVDTSSAEANAECEKMAM